MGKKKAKRAAPTKPCGACGKPNHARKLVCDHCGKSTGTAVKKKAAPKRAKRKASSKELSRMEIAAELVKLSERAGGWEKVEATAKLVPDLLD